MTRTADLLTVLHDIDTYRGKICRTCYFYERRTDDGGMCLKGYDPAPGGHDGCEDWKGVIPMRYTNLLK